MWKIQENRAIKQGGKLLVKKALEQGSVEYSAALAEAVSLDGRQRG
jgi:hypothetical protein